MEPFRKEEAINQFGYLLDFTNFCTNEEKGRKFWIMWNINNPLDVVSMSDLMITRWAHFSG